MSKADEMFRALKYNKVEDDTDIEYRTCGGDYINFDKDYDTIDIDVNYLTPQEALAIYTKCKELGWIQEEN